ncbi:zinc ABC transporter substrate-binding protein [Robertmurraya korlensis]|uniref:metal ABC transporter solute-binding protein, Zn/Mn family n=1 Tax=Robertmurraya korlensis TaxID=519977 RepID=UPI00203C48AA|nr:zinc ABC transporter substrate-binding protein [Robertmurraya korlensis]MCM3599133.1 zinc ABC transporter substrate-binding protein [Robertmurraya korlensis]
MFRKYTAFVFMILIATFLAGCQGDTAESSQEDDKLSIYTTVYPLQYFTERIGGDLVNVQSIYPNGADEHSYEPSQKDMIDLADSDLFFYIGLGLEGFVSKAEKALKNENVTLVATAEHITFEEHAEETEEEHAHEETSEEHAHEEEDEHNHGDVDPHVWLDPIYAISLAEEIKEQLLEKLPDDKEQIEENFAALEKELQQLNDDFTEVTSTAKHKEFLVSHAAFGYWSERYGLEQISVSGLASTNEPTQKELENIIAEAEEHDLHYIFFEQNVSSKLTEIVQKEIGAEPLTLHNLSTLTDEDVKEERTYFTIMKDNLEALQTALNE